MNAADLAKVISFRIAQIVRETEMLPEITQETVDKFQDDLSEALEVEEGQGPMIILFDDLEKALEFLEQQEPGGEDPFV